jgi:hypothetical protein
MLPCTFRWKGAIYSSKQRHTLPLTSVPPTRFREYPYLTAPPPFKQFLITPREGRTLSLQGPDSRLASLALEDCIRGNAPRVLIVQRVVQPAALLARKGRPNDKLGDQAEVA